MYVIFKLRAGVTGPEFIYADDVDASPQMADINEQGVTPCTKTNVCVKYHMVMDPFLWIQYCVAWLVSTSSPAQYHHTRLR